MPLGAEGQPDPQTPLAPAIRAAAEYLAKDDIEAALAALDPFIREPDAPLAARFVLALLAWKKGRLDWALDIARECHESDPMDGAIAEVLASLYAQAGDPVESIYAAKLATALGNEGPLAALVPKDFPPFGLAYVSIQEKPKLARARRDLATGKLDDAIENARQHVALQKFDMEGRAFHAALLLRTGRAAEAVEQFHGCEKAAQSSGALAGLYARCLAAAGEVPAALRWHGEAQALAPGDAAIAATRVADGIWLEDARTVAERGAAWTRRFCPPQPRKDAQRDGSGPIVIAYLVNALADAADAALIADVARSHDRSRARIIAYGRGAQSFAENGLLQGAFDGWQDIGELDAATIARYLNHDGVSVAVDASGFLAPQSLLALGRAGHVRRVSWLGNPGALRAPLYDAILEAYPLPQVQRQIDRVQRATTHFGAEVTLPQLTDEIVALWAGILRVMPTARLLLRTHDTGRGVVGRLVARFGAELAARIDLVSGVLFDEFYALVDVAIAPRLGMSPRMAAEAMACGVPIVALAGPRATEPYAAFLEGIAAEGAVVAANDGVYVQAALALARARPRTAAPRALDAAAIAALIEREAVGAVAAVA